jgi:hypothetical protein
MREGVAGLLREKTRKPGLPAGAAPIYSFIESATPSSTVSTRSTISPTCSPASPIIRHDESPNSSPGTGNRSTPPALPPKPAHSPSAYLRAYRANVSTTITHPTNEPSADDAAVSVIAMPAGLPNNEMTSSCSTILAAKSPQ